MLAEYEITSYADPNAVDGITRILTLTREQLAGIALMSQVVTSRYHLRVYRRSDHHEMLSDLDYYRQYYIGSGSSLSVQMLNHQYQQFIQFGLHTPADFVNSLNFNRQSHMGPFPTESYRATSNYINFQYWCFLTGDHETLIAQFNTPRFLQGAISACQWLGTDWRNHITLIHHRNQLKEIVSFA